MQHDVEHFLIALYAYVDVDPIHSKPTLKLIDQAMYRPDFASIEGNFANSCE